MISPRQQFQYPFKQDQKINQPKTNTNQIQNQSYGV
jgi:hypothetical protein